MKNKKEELVNEGLRQAKERKFSNSPPDLESDQKLVDQINNYPESEKVLKIKDKAQVCGEFLDWLKGQKGIIFCKYNNCVEREEFYRVDIPVLEYLYEFFEIDFNKYEEEKVQMLEELRNEET